MNMVNLMINIKSQISEFILIRHANYVVYDSNIMENLNLIRAQINDELTAEYWNKLSIDHGGRTKPVLIKSMHKFIDMLINEVGNLKSIVEHECYSDSENNSNFFIAKPKFLNSRIAEIKAEHPLATQIIKYDGSQKLFKKTFTVLILKALQYDKFSLKNKDILGYRSFLKKLKSPNSDFYKNVKIKTERYRGDRKYDENRLQSIKKIICFEINSYNITESLKEVHDSLVDKISNIKVNKIGKTISEICEVIAISFDECIRSYEKVDFNIHLYNDFIINKKNANWNAYQFVMAMGTKSCPYCNRQYITPVYSERNGSIRADLDHFFPKSLYPYFSISLYNLVPCCKFCNSSLKLNYDFNYDSHLHPYEHGFEDYLKFRFKAIESTLSGTSNDEFEIVMEPESINDTENQSFKAQNNAKIFKIESLYNYHRDEVKSLIRKKLIYNEGYCQEICKRLESLLKRVVSKQEVLEFIVSNTTEVKRLHERTLSKLYKDIIEQLDFFEDSIEKSESVISEEDFQKLKRLID